LWELVQKYEDRQVRSLCDLEARFRYQDFDQFLEVWSWKNGFLRQYEDFTFIAQAVARDLASQRILYAEAFFSPTDFSERHLTPDRLASAIREGLARVPEVQVSLVADLVRDHGPVRGARTLATLSDARSLGVVGVGIGGSEHRFPPTPFAPVYEEARRLGFFTSAHAGEAAGPESVWSAIDDLRVDRVGHGTRAIEDPRLVAALAERHIHVEACPVSNVRTAAVQKIASHPIRRLFDAGVAVSVSTDDPKMFNTSLAGELRGLHQELGFSADEIRELLLAAARDSWLAPSGKERLVAAMITDPAWALPDTLLHRRHPC
jgi:adenosine deaminase